MKKTKQEAPISFRPYPPIKDALGRHDVKNRGYFINCALGAMLGVPPELLEEYKRGDT